MNARIRIATLAAVLLAATAAQAGEVYQWKDARGVTHYSDSPPPAKAEAKNVRTRDLGAEAAASATATPVVSSASKPATAAAPVAAATAAATTDAPAIDPALAKANCEAARTNLQRLKSGGYVGVDDNGDGQPDQVMSPEEVKSQTAATEGQVKAFCGAAG